MAATAARWMAVGITSLDDWPKLTSSLGWTVEAPSSSSVARPAITSLALVLVDVPDPVWKMSSGNWSSSRPSRTSSAAVAMASALAAGRWPAGPAIRAADPLTRPSAQMNRRGKRIPEMGKLSTARCVDAP